VRKNLRILTGFLNTMIPAETRMEEYSRRGFAAASELANTLVRKSSVTYRQAHHVAGTVVRMAAERNITADQVDAGFLNEAAERVLGKTLALTDAEVHEALDPGHFIDSHRTRGGVAPVELERMVKDRGKKTADARQRQNARKNRLEEAGKKLGERIRALVS